MSNLQLYIGPAEPDEPLPMQYLPLAEMTGPPHQTVSLTCGRCERSWAEHRWVLFGPGWQELDCSNRRRSEL